jgi:hypothetical protein
MSTDKQIRYATLWRNKWLTSDCTTLEQMVDSLQGAADYIKSLKEAGFLLDAQGGPDDYMTIYTFDKALADQFEIGEDEFWNDEEFDEDEEDELEEEDLPEED